ncbi:hypothetical protein COT60_02935 [Candidatus Pacearchaeota archaeon CG09_land_8_20_14_0_10_30_9]|nr:hypothetical protein [Candidatus Pacearchaeota archaeon]OIO40509.1 MAG: hypothetical protein AUJ61_01895 [Candidatus Pacearchaeota archaeon CG1_02_30_18]PIN71238.1 MAG: hypothetical protein COV77_03130 [Candidatus Pacearchaeota archaeon CG11_big_fil_rev_8_21_14_0_20_30_13]PIO00968.1 MAG: hypothetical protein COT60_02935 [Candidatus Pacearchaeota archaeon CG09_land_8_20_14_0_10_30_9]PJA71047.1 MAG: hypothetical protein CO153_03740 [Candidatus Pacearchaeota archaeon CG_4_9_14_3_um_filter_30_11
MANKTKTEKRKGGQIDKELYIQIGLIVILVLVIGFNLGKVSSGTSGGIGTVSASEIIPTGIPAIYGNDMGVSYNDVSASNPKLADTTIRKLAQYEDMELSSEEMARYITIAGSISCEYCCGANSIIFNNGERACGCAHSFAMRGLAKYLLRNHPDMTNDAILSELGKWKVLFFPDIHEQKAQALEANGIDSTNYINLASNLYRGIEQGQTSGGSMVGGC